MSRTSKKTASLRDQAAELAGQVVPHLESARDTVLNDYLPHLESARDTVLNDYLPRAQDLVAEAVHPKPRKRHRVRKLLTVLGVIGLAAVVVKRLQPRTPVAAYEGAPVVEPVAAPTAAPTAEPTAAEDQGSLEMSETEAPAPEPPAAELPESPAADDVSLNSFFDEVLAKSKRGVSPE